ncbi:MAG TPA: hypothetical protein DDZ51_04815 [Planctomycetaceae bacterium]|nr:hypothetical protein [Planctomycetaceae bacterium]
MNVASVLVATCTFAVLGCGNGDSSGEPVSGTVTFDGQPVESGDILLFPAGGGGTPEGGKITDGKFQFQASDGPKRVEIVATREEGAAADGLPNYVSYIPKQYNTNSTLTQTVTKGNENVFVFDLRSGAK